MSRCQTEHKPYKKFYNMKRQSTFSETKNIKEKEVIVFMIVDDNFMGMQLPYAVSNESIRKTIRQAGGFWCQNFKIWKIPKQTYTSIRTVIPTVVPNAKIQDLPRFIDSALKPITQKLIIESMNRTLLYDPLDRHKQIQENPLFEKLYDFQKITVRLAIKNYGRLLIADEMGVGKSIQGLACALTYISDWPLLIICPSSLKFIWKEEIKKWLIDFLKKGQVQVIEKYGTPINHEGAKIVIFSYDIASKSVDKLNKFKTVIADEAHYLKNQSAKRTQNLLPFLCTRKRIFLLTGTPALAKPRQTFNLIQIVRPDIYSGIKEFGDRYCFKQMNRWNMRVQYEGNRNIAELHYLLKDRIMIRRLKQEVIHELPDKQRQLIIIETEKSLAKEIKSLLSTEEIPLDVLRNSQKLIDSGFSDEDGMSPMPKCYYLSGIAKIQGVKAYIASVLENDVKIIIFAHHHQVMDQIENFIKSQNIEYIRIDGTTANQTRSKKIKAFQEDFLVRVALLSITAAGIGITLTAASTIIFAELYWTPAVLLQAEDRAHRIGQKNCVNIHYLIGENTIDHLLWRHLERKIETTGNILNGESGHFQAESVEKGKIGEVNQPTQEVKIESKPISSYFKLNKVSKEKAENIEEELHQRKKGKVQSDIDEDSIAQEQLQKLIKAKEEEIRERKRKQLEATMR